MFVALFFVLSFVFFFSVFLKLFSVSVCVLLLDKAKRVRISMKYHFRLKTDVIQTLPCKLDFTHAKYCFATYFIIHSDSEYRHTHQKKIYNETIGPNLFCVFVYAELFSANIRFFSRFFFLLRFFFSLTLTFRFFFQLAVHCFTMFAS